MSILHDMVVSLLNDQPAGFRQPTDEITEGIVNTARTIRPRLEGNSAQQMKAAATRAVNAYNPEVRLS